MKTNICLSLGLLSLLALPATAKEVQGSVFTYKDGFGNYYDMVPAGDGVTEFLMIANGDGASCIAAQKNLRRLKTVNCFENPRDLKKWSMPLIINSRGDKYTKFQVYGTNRCLGTSIQLVNCDSRGALILKLPKAETFRFKPQII